MQSGPGSGSDEPDPSVCTFEWVVLAAALAAGVVLRFWTESHLWLDEALSVDIARLPIGDIPAALRHDGHPPLYYLLLHEWISVFGQGDTAVRSLSGVCSVATLPLAWFAGRRIGGRRTAAVLVAFVALSPFAIRYGTETRMYALVMLLVFAGYLLVTAALDGGARWLLPAVTVVTGLLLLSHYWALWLVAAVLVVLLWRARRREGPARRRTVHVIVAVAAGGVLLLPWLGVMLDQSAHTGTPWAAPVRPTTLVTTTLQDFGGGEFAEALLFGWGLAALFAVGLFGRTLDEHRVELDVRTQPAVRQEALIVGVTIAIATAAGYATATTFATRYAAVFFPLFMVVAAVGATRFAGRLPRDAVVGTLLVFGLVGGLHNAVTDRTQAGVIANAIRDGGQRGDVVLICPDQLGPSVHRSLPSSLGLEQLAYPTLGDPSLVDWRDYEKRNRAVDPVAIADAVVARSTGAHAVWLVTSGSYKTLEGQCEAVEHELGVKLGGGQLVVVDNGDSFFEHASLLKFTGRAP